ncbi:8476_t:CDS:2 [Funneliformis geosporum]|nr:8476_t:CDS:2 [Funneliformis geosporum]
MTAELLTAKDELSRISSNIGSEIGSEISELGRRGEEIKKERVEELMRKLQHYDRRQGELENDYARQQELLRKKNEEVCQLNAKLREINAKYNKNLKKEKELLLANFHKQAEQINHLTAELKKAEVAEKNSQNLIAGSQKAYERKKSELTRLQEDYERYKTNSHGTLSKNAELENKLSRTTQEKGELEEKIKKLEEEVGILREVAKSVGETARTEKGELRDRVIRQEETIIRQNARIGELEESLKNDGAAVETLTKAFGEEKNLARLNAELAKISSKKEGLTAEITRLNTKINELAKELQEKLKTAETEKGELETRLAEVLASVETLNKRIKDIESDKDA